MTCLVTGANGFVGAAVVRALLEDDRNVRCFVRPKSDRRNLEGLDVELAEGDLTDVVSLDRALTGCRHAFHVAADYRLWVPRPAAMYSVNVDGSVNVIKAAARAGLEKLVYTSSVAVLGINADRTPADETTPVTVEDMVGTYKRSKFLAEEAVWRSAAETGLPVTVVNPSTPIGPGDVKPTPTGRIIVDGARGRIPAYVDTGLNLVHVDDVARGHLLALESGRPGERYVLGGTDLSLKDILALVARLSGRKPPRVRLARSLVYPVAFAGEWIARLTGGEPLVTRDELRMSKKHMYFTSSKAAAELGYRARDPAHAVADALDWFARHGYLDG
jgi:dihydroflavonol-4-reductase